MRGHIESTRSVCARFRTAHAHIQAAHDIDKWPRIEQALLEATYLEFQVTQWIDAEDRKAKRAKQKKKARKKAERAK